MRSGYRALLKGGIMGSIDKIRGAKSFVLAATHCIFVFLYFGILVFWYFGILVLSVSSTSLKAIELS